MYNQINNAEMESVKRIKSGLFEFDWMMGYTHEDGGWWQGLGEKVIVSDKNIWGMPKGKLILLAGEAGVGKSRLSASLVNSLSKSGHKVAYIQTEADSSCHYLFPENFNCFSIDKRLDVQIQDIRDNKPDIVFIDSINNIDEYNTGTAKNVKQIIDAYREVGNEIGCTIIFLGQLNSDGSVKGSSTLLHLPDIVIHAENTDKNGEFSIRVGNKHRYGRTGSQFISSWRHYEDGVKCLSTNRFSDGKYLDSGGWLIEDDKEEYDKWTAEKNKNYNEFNEYMRQEMEKIDEKFKRKRHEQYLKTPAKETPQGARMPVNQPTYDALNDVNKYIYRAYGVPGTHHQTQEENYHYLESITDWDAVRKIQRKEIRKYVCKSFFKDLLDEALCLVKGVGLGVGGAILWDYHKSIKNLKK